MDILDTVRAKEREKYDAMWSVDEYKNAPSPGFNTVDRFMKLMQPLSGSTLIDLGCGDGGAGLEFAKRGLDVWWLDLTDVGLLQAVPRERFFQKALWDKHYIGGHRVQFQFGFCVDVLEHLPTEYTLLTVERLLQSCVVLWLQIAHLPETHGALIGQQLHLTVRPHVWWTERLAAVGKLHEARDICGRGLYVVGR